MTRERYLWYKKEIERLRKLDNYITDKVRASYTIMIEQNNNDNHLRYLWITKQIDYSEYFFRKKAKELKIKTYKL